MNLFELKEKVKIEQEYLKWVKEETDTFMEKLEEKQRHPEFREIIRSARETFKYQHVSTHYSDLLDLVLKHPLKISNEKLCELLKNSTGEEWHFKIGKQFRMYDPTITTLTFYSKTERIGVMYSELHNEEVLANTNWFNVVANAKPVGNYLTYQSVIEKSPWILPITMDKTIQKALTSFIATLSLEHYGRFLDQTTNTKQNTKPSKPINPTTK